ncbi:MAG: D-inositol-3-phosphate glycosyltransferase [Chloroflexia bacterium]|nr:D-inositol-3-phosphate glycosyltransferase [Chloroflexia bacterium]
MRILYVNPYYKPYLGGIERIIEQISAYMLKQDEVEAVGVLTTRAYFPDRILTDLPAHEVIDGVDVFRCDFKPSTLPRLFHAALAGYVSLGVPRVLRRFRPDIVHATYSEWWAGNLEVYLASLRSAHIQSMHYHELPLVKRTLPLFLTNRWLLKRVDALQVQTEVERMQVHRAYGAPLSRTVIIPPGTDIPESVPDRTIRSDIHPVTILAVGRVTEHKGQHDLVRMVANLLKSPGRGSLPPLRLVLAGEDAGTGERILKYVEQHGLQEVVRVVGRPSDTELAQLYRDADIFALPTRYESFGIVYIEAMSYGLPVVTYGVGPVPSILTRGSMLAPQGDEAAFSAHLEDLLRDRTLRLRLGTEARELALGYSWERTGEQYYRLYRQVLAPRRSRDSGKGKRNKAV